MVIRRSLASACLATIVLTACGGSSTGTTETSATEPVPTESATMQPETGPTPFPDLRNSEVSLSEGTYVTSTFADPIFSMTLPGVWTFFDQGPTNLQVNKGTGVSLESNLSVFGFFGRVVDPRHDQSITKTNDLISWIEQNPHLEVTRRASPIQIGGVKGREIDFRPIGAPLCSYAQDGSRCWNLMPIIDGNPFTPENQELGTMYVVGSDVESPDDPFSYRLAVVDFGGSDVVFIWQEDASAFDQTVQTFEDVLASIEVGA
jgi:hypothetical protein